MHAVHLVPPADASVSVTEPPAHSSQLMACVPEYRPATQSTQAVVDSAEAWPAAQAVHLVASADASVSVAEPPPQAVHTNDSAPLYMPASHTLHATVGSSVASRLLPAVQLLQKLFPPISWYLPASHDMQSSA